MTNRLPLRVHGEIGEGWVEFEREGGDSTISIYVEELPELIKTLQLWVHASDEASSARSKPYCSPEARMLQSLVDEIADTAGWTDRTPLHAVLHIRNLIRNMQATIATYEREPPCGSGGGST